jgi:CHAT domain-containing protein
MFPSHRLSVFRREYASEEQVKNHQLVNYKIVHFATHSVIDDNMPARSSIVLSLDDNLEEDGFLQVREIYNLKMNADLVTLSSCESGLGKFIRGEGIEGLTGAFFYAGASSVLMSLWEVNDQATSQLMERFYFHLHSSISIRDALRKTKLEMIESETISHPYYWAGFIVSGRADQVVLEKISRLWFYLAAALFSMGILVVWRLLPDVLVIKIKK